MDIRSYGMEAILLTALKSEVDSAKIYKKLAKNTDNVMLKNKLNFLATEEEKHRDFFVWLYEKKLNEKPASIPDVNPIPLPEIIIPHDIAELRFSDIFAQAMVAEQAAIDFYEHIADILSETPKIQNMLRYIASMEQGHYELLKLEKQNAESFEAYDVHWPMMHVGP